MANKDNLREPWKPGESGNPAGKPKGTRSWATILQDLLNDADLADSLLEKKPGWWDKLPNKNMHEAIGVSMGIKAMNGDTKAAAWVRKTAYGDKIDFTSDGAPMRTVSIFDMRTDTEMHLVPVTQPPKPKAKASKKVVQRKPKSKQ